MKIDYYFIGIGGISMSSLAVFAKKNGFLVEGSDIIESDCTNILKEYEITYHIGHRKENLKKVKNVVYNSAIHEDNEEYIYAKENNIPLLSRAEFLGEISSEYNNVIAISGTHGKTTTSALISEIFEHAEKNPTIHVGGILKKYNSNFLIGSEEFFITEACEYMDNFLALKPKVGIILNVEKDHMDYFKNINNLRNSFIKFSKNSEMTLVSDDLTWLEGENIRNYGLKHESYYSLRNIKETENGYIFDYYEKGEYKHSFKSKIIGEHNILNSLCAIAISRIYEIPFCFIQDILLSFEGVKRRNELVGYFNEAKVIHDYAHHPTEIQKITGMLSNPYGKLIIIFQPHTYSRTKKLYFDFIKVLSGLEYIFLFKTYPARESEDRGKSAKDLFDSLKDLNKNCYYFEDYENIKNKIKSIAKKNDIILILGAGDIDKFSTYLCEK